MIRLLHCADLHIDSPFSKYPPSVREKKRADVMASFKAMIDYIISEKIEICLIAGDLFDSDNPSDASRKEVRAGFERARDCRFFISPGNHDPYTENGVYATFDLGENVTVFKSEHIARVSLAPLEADIYGYAFTSRTMKANPLSELRVANNGRINILLAHGDTSSAVSDSCPISTSDIMECGADYIALGHLHNIAGINKINETYYGYSGCLCGRDFGETGEKGAYLCELSRENGFFTCNSVFVPFGVHKYLQEEADISGLSDDESVAERLTEISKINLWGDDCSVRFRLVGRIVSEYLPHINAISAMTRGLHEVQIKNETVPDVKGSKLEKDLTLRGEFFRMLAPMLETGTAEERARAAAALRLGLCAIDGGNLDEI